MVYESVNSFFSIERILGGLIFAFRGVGEVVSEVDASKKQLKERS